MKVYSVAIRESYLPRTGLSNFKSWCPPLPRNGSPADFDMVLHDAPTGRLLVAEFKQGTGLTEGQRITMEGLASMGCEVLLVDEAGLSNPPLLDDALYIATVPSWGPVRVSLQSFRKLVRAFFEDRTAFNGFMETIRELGKPQQTRNGGTRSEHEGK